MTKADNWFELCLNFFLFINVSSNERLHNPSYFLSKMPHYQTVFSYILLDINKTCN